MLAAKRTKTISPPQLLIQIEGREGKEKENKKPLQWHINTHLPLNRVEVEKKMCQEWALASQVHLVCRTAEDVCSNAAAAAKNDTRTK